MKSRRFGRAVLRLAVAALAVYAAVVSWLIVRQGNRDEAQPADAIVVFGAAEYYGRPSPVFRARLDHALELYYRGLAPFVITTGGSGAELQFSEGGVGLDYLEKHGIPPEKLIAETQAANTERSAERVANIMRTNRMRTCVAVSDGFHIFRIKHMLAGQGIVVYGSPRAPTHGQSAWRRALLVAREVVSYSLWKTHIT